MVVYWVRNAINDKVYVGQTSTSLERRWYMHTWDGNSNSLLHRAIKKYGKDKFKIESIHNCETKEEMDFVEIFYIGFLGTKAPNGYNLTDGGEGTLGTPCSEEKKAKIGLANKGKPPNPRLLDQSGPKNHMFGRHISEEQKEALRRANKGHKRSYGNKSALGHIVSEETRNKIREKRLHFPKKTHCIRGHERTKENLGSGGKCKLCQKIANDSRYKKNQ